jgi:hypothetical protein
MNNILIIIVIVIIVYFLLNNNTEKMTNITDEEQKQIDKVYNYVINNPNSSFADYINYLTGIKNTNLHIIDNEVFVTFKLLQKKNMFSKVDIISAMKLD